MRVYTYNVYIYTYVYKCTHRRRRFATSPALGSTSICQFPVSNKMDDWRMEIMVGNLLPTPPPYHPFSQHYDMPMYTPRYIGALQELPGYFIFHSLHHSVFLPLIIPYIYKCLYIYVYIYRCRSFSTACSWYISA